MAEYNAEIYKKAFEIAVRCARELNGTPELKEAYQEAQKDNRALKSFMDFCLEKATEEASDHTVTDIVPVVRCKDCVHWCDCKVKLADGTYRDYLPSEVFGDATLDKGVNVGSHCTLHGYEDSSGSWFWARPDDFCSRAEKRGGE